MQSGGYPASLFEGDVQNYLCGVCLEVYKDPHQCQKGHCFCRTCALKSIEIKARCPICACRMDLSCLSRNIVARNIVDGLIIRCTINDLQEMVGCKVFPRDCKFQETEEAMLFGQERGKSLVGFGIEICKDSEDMYAGYHVNALRHGRGVLHTVADGSCYTGGFMYGRIYGLGAMATDDQSKYHGHFEDGEIVSGTHEEQGGMVYTGSFTDSKREGKGRMTSDGKVWDCEWSNDLVVAGRGIISSTASDGPTYDGHLANGGKQDGRGIRYVSLSGDFYIGDWRDDKKMGKGVHVLPDGSYYQGDFENDKFHGDGSILYGNKSFYRGEFRNGLAHGKGVWRDCTGNSYRGAFEHGKFGGIGKLINADNCTSFEGQFIDDLPHGEGEWTHSNGNKRKISWEHGDISNGCCCIDFCGLSRNSTKCKKSIY